VFFFTDKIYSEFSLTLDQLLDRKGLRFVAMPRDGYCLLHQFVVLAENEGIEIRTTDLLKQLKCEITANLPDY
jgi:hypothetical protein